MAQSRLKARLARSARENVDGAIPLRRVSKG